LFTEELGIDFNGDHDEPNLFRWFLASTFFGRPISATAATKTAKIFIDRGHDCSTLLGIAIY